MAIDVTVKKTEPMTVAFLSVRGPYTLISESFGKLYGWIGEKGYVPSGPPLGVYTSIVRSRCLLRSYCGSYNHL